MTANPLEQLSDQRCFGGSQRRYRHRSQSLACEMTLGVFLPPQALQGAPVPALYWLSGLTCTDENFVQKAGAQHIAAELGIALITPDTSPRGEHVARDPAGGWDLGLGAGFYLNATQQPWSANYQMHDYVVHELPQLLENALPLTSKRGISGHSMGGHGALVCALRNPGRYLSVSALAPICHPTACAWGEKVFSEYLGADRETWQAWDASVLLRTSHQRLPILLDQGEADAFLATQLLPQALEAAARACDYPLTLRQHAGYDHSYFFVASFIDAHLRHHAQALLR